MKDKNGNVLTVGDKFLYQPGTPHEHTGEIFDCGGIQVIKWDDDEIVAVKDFYYPPSDQEIIEKL